MELVLVVCPGQVTGVALGAAVGFGITVAVKVGVGEPTNMPAGSTGSRLHPVAMTITPNMKADRQTNNVFNRICYTPMSYDEIEFPRQPS
jgi:hypothetical protein